ncbi:hypothetical protein JXJ21_04460 [candidate division KSB1 bacterium]|nr:hypothetical protein [candidate division KSB1 bacterium]
MRLKFPILIYVITFSLLVNCAAPSERPQDYDTQGGLNYEKCLTSIRIFADVLLEYGRDTYGKINTPMFLSMLDLKTRQRITQKDPNWERDYDHEDYMLNARGSNLYRDTETIRAFYKLTQLTGDSTYHRAADAYLSAFLEKCVSPTTGLFAWGEHIFYHVLRDTVEANRHEVEIPLPLVQELWEVDPQKVQRYADAIYDYHIYDKTTFDYDRHGNYTTGKFDDPDVRGTWIKHSGLFTYIFLVAYTRTGEPKYLDWARKMTHVFWDRRNKHTNLVVDLPQYSTNPVCSQNLLLSTYLIEASQVYRDDFILNCGLAYMKSVGTYAHNPDDTTFFQELLIATGKPASTQQQYIWSPWELTPRAGRAALIAANLSGDDWFLDLAKTYALYMHKSSIPPLVSPGALGEGIRFYVALYNATSEMRYLEWARQVARHALENYFENGLIKESSDGYIYSAKSGAGNLALGMLELYETENALPIHWQVPREIASGEKTVPFCIQLTDASVLGVRYQFGDQAWQQLNFEPKASSHFSFNISIPEEIKNNRLRFRLEIPNSKQSNHKLTISDSVIIDDDLNGPQFSRLDYDAYVCSGNSALIQISIEDMNSVKSATLSYAHGKGERMRVKPFSVHGSTYQFKVPRRRIR